MTDTIRVPVGHLERVVQCASEFISSGAEYDDYKALRAVEALLSTYRFTKQLESQSPAAGESPHR